MSNCKNAGVVVAETLKVGDELPVTKEYLGKVFDTLVELSVKIVHALRRKIEESSREDADKNLVQIGYELLEKKRYDLALRILEYSNEILRKKCHSERFRRFCVINFANCKRLVGDHEGMKQVLGLEDWSATGIQFDLVISALNSDFSNSARLMKKIGKDSELISDMNYMNWPVFSDFRNSPEFKEAFVEVFGQMPELEIEAGARSMRKAFESIQNLIREMEKEFPLSNEKTSTDELDSVNVSIAESDPVNVIN